jgi:hypothetical protein
MITAIVLYLVAHVDNDNKQANAMIRLILLMIAFFQDILLMGRLLI